MWCFHLKHIQAFKSISTDGALYYRLVSCSTKTKFLFNSSKVAVTYYSTSWDISQPQIVHPRNIRSPKDCASIHHTDELIFPLEIIAGNMWPLYYNKGIYEPSISQPHFELSLKIWNQLQRLGERKERGKERRRENKRNGKGEMWELCFAFSPRVTFIIILLA